MKRKPRVRARGFSLAAVSEVRLTCSGEQGVEPLLIQLKSLYHREVTADSDNQTLLSLGASSRGLRPRLLIINEPGRLRLRRINLAPSSWVLFACLMSGLCLLMLLVVILPLAPRQLSAFVCPGMTLGCFLLGTGGIGLLQRKNPLDHAADDVLDAQGLRRVGRGSWAFVDRRLGVPIGINISTDATPLRLARPEDGYDPRSHIWAVDLVMADGQTRWLPAYLNMFELQHLLNSIMALPGHRMQQLRIACAAARLPWSHEAGECEGCGCAVSAEDAQACRYCGLTRRYTMLVPRCAACDYDLSGLNGDRCPECGASLRADDQAGVLRCATCNYDLSGLNCDRCPECGT